MQVAVSDLEREFPGRVRIANVDATLPASREAVARHGFRTHGLVVTAGDGAVLLAQPDHDTDIAGVRSVLLRHLGQASSAAPPPATPQGDAGSSFAGTRAPSPQ